MMRFTAISKRLLSNDLYRKVGRGYNGKTTNSLFTCTSNPDKSYCTAKLLLLGAAGIVYIENDDSCYTAWDCSINLTKPLKERFARFYGLHGMLMTLLQRQSPFPVPDMSTSASSRADGSLPRTHKESEPYLTRYVIADAVSKAAPAVVNITVNVGMHNMFFGRSSGSGSIIHSDGTILTNAHVVAEVGKGPHLGKVLVTLHDGRSFNGEVVSYDLITDIAVVKIKSKSPLPTVELGSSRNLRPGEWVVAVGSPLHLQNTVTAGIISAVDRKSTELGLQGASTDYIQTDAAINQGNSGGPLINLDGEVIGINTMKALTASGVSFAIPIDTAIKVVEQLRKHGRVVRPWLGMKMLELTAAIIDQLRERDSAFPKVTGGLMVPQVIPGSPAEKGGIRNGDIIIRFDGRPVTSVNQVIEALGDKVGSRFEVVVKRAGDKEVTLYVVTEEATPSS